MITPAVIMSILLSIFTPYKVQYSTVGLFTNTCEHFSGHISHNILTGHGTINVSGPNHIRCQGDSHTSQHTLSCSQVSGVASLTCTDGRKVTTKWSLADCSSGGGKGTDAKGNPFVFGIGESDAQAQANLLKASPPGGACPHPL